MPPQKPPFPPSSLYDMEAAMKKTMSALRDDLQNRKADKKQVKLSCTYCGKVSESGKLATCSRCRSVRYCDATCQLKHFRASHKLDCKNFKDPPITEFFNVRNRPGTNYPMAPVFAKASLDGVGCWVSVMSSLNCALQSTLDLTSAYDSKDIAVPGPATSKLLAENKGLQNNLLTLHILVQNRRKDPIMIFAGRIMLIGTDYGGKRFREWESPGDELTDLPMPSSGRMCVGVGTFKDPWGVRRSSVLSVNGVPVHPRHCALSDWRSGRPHASRHSITATKHSLARLPLRLPHLSIKSRSLLMEL
ncbi:hypothetical protein BOTBODRAFT_55521 [Botryobasidium botryosum FD-172 SS1]|uniref:MYND-type domain-containing protein n=1 Tax=Botryobasidium botryosum (strain FD-172 SS1) TaxID=930990 RepID=A0A067MS47_BOTB1|nr:hypothetical protein BOTBODRAFT_55521 [Botryobasidium botryosum FD-172 SS1]